MYMFLYIFKQVTSKIWFDVLFRGRGGFMKNFFVLTPIYERPLKS